MAVHQTARFSSDPKISHERAIKRIYKYLQGTKERGMIYKPDKTKGIECFVDADFAGNWTKADADNPENCLSRTGYIICIAGCHVTWTSKLQSEITLSTAEAEYVALSTAMRELIPFIRFIKELSTFIEMEEHKPKMKIRVYEDNEGAICMANALKFTPRTKHIALKYHHFRSHVKNKIIEILSIDTDEQTADILTKPLETTSFEYLRKKLCCW